MAFSVVGGVGSSSIPPSRLLKRQTMAASIRAVLTAALLASGVASQDPNKKPKFAYPPFGSDKVFNKLDTVIVTYTAFYDTAVLYTFCQPGTGKLSEFGLLCGWAVAHMLTKRGKSTSKRRPASPRACRSFSISRPTRRAGSTCERASTASTARTARRLT